MTNRTRTSGARSPAERLEPGRAPSRPRGLQAREPSRFVSGLVRFTSGILTLALVGMVVLGTAAFAVYYQYGSPGPLMAAKSVTIPKGESRFAIAERLEREGIIANRWTFSGGHLMQSLMGGRKNLDLKAGEYLIPEHATMRQVAETLADGKSILYKTTVPEGLTSEQIVERIKAEPNLTGQIAHIPDEGTLLPDTYHYSKGSSRQEIIDRMQQSMKSYIDDIWSKRSAASPFRSPLEMVTFASIVEKETGRDDERSRVSAVFHNRIKKNMRLQSDPTIIYGIVGGQGSLGRGITKADIETKTPYNTYRIDGLPPGPICNPGRASLQAALEPAQSTDLYFVADGTGGHTFTDTLKEHNSAVQKWREVEKKARIDTTATALEPDPDTAPIPASASITPADAAKPTSKSKLITAPPPPAAKTSAADIPLPVRKPKQQ